MAEETKALTVTQQVDKMLTTGAWRSQFEEILGKNYGAFKASVVSLITGDKSLQSCEPKFILAEVLKAASLGFTVNKQLGHAWIIPYKGVPQFQIGYKGMIQLALRTGRYRYLNADKVYEGEVVKADRITGAITITGKPESNKVQGYFAYFELLEGFNTAVYMTTESVKEWAKRYNPKGSARPDSVWVTNFDAMALKTVVKKVLKFGPISIEYQDAVYDPEEEEVSNKERGKQMAENNENLIEGEYTLVSDQGNDQGNDQGQEIDCPF